jgi:hypothetical protein
MTKERVESMLRERGLTGDIIWRDNRKSTYQQVYDWLMKHPERTLEHFGVEE